MSELIERLRLAAEDAAGGPPSAEQVDALIDLVDALEARLAALTTPQEAKWEHGVIGGDDLLARLMDTLAYYHCRSVNPKADSPYLGYHAMSEDQREFLREKQREAAEEVLRMWHAESRPPAPQGGDVRERLIEQVRFHAEQEAGLRDDIGNLEAERDAALAAIERVTRAKLEVDSVHQFHGNDCLCGFSSARSRSRTEHITGALLAALDGAPEPEEKP